jgi:hypothetical protein
METICIVISWKYMFITGVVAQEGDEGSEGLLLFTLLIYIYLPSKHAE